MTMVSCLCQVYSGFVLPRASDVTQPLTNYPEEVSLTLTFLCCSFWSSASGQAKVGIYPEVSKGPGSSPGGYSGVCMGDRTSWKTSSLSLS